MQAELELTMPVADAKKAEWRDRAAIGLAVLAFIFTAMVSHYSRTDRAMDQDTAAYVFQAKLFASGRLSTAAPPDARLLPSYYLCVHDGKCYAGYTPGHSLFLVPGVWLGMLWFMPALGTALTVWLVYLIVRDVYGSVPGLLAAGMCAVSPAIIGMGATLFSEPTSRLVLAVFVLGLLRWLRSGGYGYAVLAAAGLGYAADTRPYTAVVFAFIATGLVVWTFWRPALVTRKRLAKGLGIGSLVFALFIGGQLTWNAAQTGDPFTSPLALLHSVERLGFGRIGYGRVEDPSTLRDYSPRDAVERAVHSVFPSVAQHTLGWGVYRMAMFPRIGIRPSIALSLMLFPLIYAAALLPVLRRGRTRYDLFFAALFLGNIVAHGFFYFDGSVRDISPIGARYHNEVTALALFPLLACAAHITWRRLGGERAAIRYALAAGVGGLLLFNTPYSHYIYAKYFFTDWRIEMQRLPGMASEAGLKNAVVFIGPTGSDYAISPVEEFPDVPLDRANVVYCFLGAIKRLGIADEDWQSLHKRLFPGREPWVFYQLTKQPPQLERLTPGEPLPYLLPVEEDSESSAH